jgi:hypothetical protein
MGCDLIAIVHVEVINAPGEFIVIRGWLARSMASTVPEPRRRLVAPDPS